MVKGNKTKIKKHNQDDSAKNNNTTPAPTTTTNNNNQNNNNNANNKQVTVNTTSLKQLKEVEIDEKPAHYVRNVDHNDMGDIDTTTTIGRMQMRMRNLLNLTILDKVEFKSTYGYFLGISLLYIFYNGLKKALNGDAAFYDASNAGKYFGAYEWLASKVLIPTNPDCSFADFCGNLCSDEKIMEALYDAKTDAHANLVQNLISQRVLATGSTEADLEDLQCPEVSAIGNEVEDGVQICCVFKTLKLISYNLQGHPSEDILERLEKSTSASKLINDILDGTKNAILPVYLCKGLTDTIDKSGIDLKTLL